MAQDNRRQLGVLEASLDKQAIAAGASAINPIWAIAHQFKYDAHFLYFYNAHPSARRLSRLAATGGLPGTGAALVPDPVRRGR
jgi:hypothetical protein